MQLKQFKTKQNILHQTEFKHCGGFFLTNKKLLRPRRDMLLVGLLPVSRCKKNYKLTYKSGTGLVTYGRNIPNSTRYYWWKEHTFLYSEGPEVTFGVGPKVKRHYLLVAPMLS